ncbi:unnamed protein product, partial [Amoebophrya sp. A120]|eukprot:GSA120T00014867001.1
MTVKNSPQPIHFVAKYKVESAYSSITPFGPSTHEDDAEAPHLDGASRAPSQKVDVASLFWSAKIFIRASYYKLDTASIQKLFFSNRKMNPGSGGGAPSNPNNNSYANLYQNTPAGTAAGGPLPRMQIPPAGMMNTMGMMGVGMAPGAAGAPMAMPHMQIGQQHQQQQHFLAQQQQLLLAQQRQAAAVAGHQLQPPLGSLQQQPAGGSGTAAAATPAIGPPMAPGTTSAAGIAATGVNHNNPMMAPQLPQPAAAGLQLPGMMMGAPPAAGGPPQQAPQLMQAQLAAAQMNSNPQLAAAQMMQMQQMAMMQQMMQNPQLSMQLMQQRQLLAQQLGAVLPTAAAGAQVTSVNTSASATANAQLLAGAANPLGGAVRAGQNLPSAAKPADLLDPAKEYTNDTTFNVSDLTRGHVSKAKYFQDLKQNCGSVAELVQQVDQFVDDYEPYQRFSSNQDCSSYLCCVYRLLQLRPSTEELTNLLEHSNPFVRCVALLMIRFVFDGKKFFEWIKPYLLDVQKIVPVRRNNSGNNSGGTVAGTTAGEAVGTTSTSGAAVPGAGGVGTTNTSGILAGGGPGGAAGILNAGVLDHVPAVHHSSAQQVSSSENEDHNFQQQNSRSHYRRGRTLTIGEFAEKLVNTDKYQDVVLLPRLAAAAFRLKKAPLMAMLDVCRERYVQNENLLEKEDGVYQYGNQIEAFVECVFGTPGNPYVNTTFEWRRGEVIGISYGSTLSNIRLKIRLWDEKEILAAQLERKKRKKKKDHDKVVLDNMDKNAGEDAKTKENDGNIIEGREQENNPQDGADVKESEEKNKAGQSEEGAAMEVDDGGVNTTTKEDKNAEIAIKVTEVAPLNGAASKPVFIPSGSGGHLDGSNSLPPHAAAAVAHQQLQKATRKPLAGKFMAGAASRKKKQMAAMMLNAGTTEKNLVGTGNNVRGGTTISAVGISPATGGFATNNATAMLTSASAVPEQLQNTSTTAHQQTRAGAGGALDQQQEIDLTEPIQLVSLGLVIQYREEDRDSDSDSGSEHAGPGESGHDARDRRSRRGDGRSRRSRSRGRRRNNYRYYDEDLTKSKGDEKEIKRYVEEYIEHYRTGAVAVGRDYATKPQGYKAMLACQRSNLGNESKRMYEDEAILSTLPEAGGGSTRGSERDRDTARDRERTGRREGKGGKWSSAAEGTSSGHTIPAAHQPASAEREEMDRRARMAQIMERYTNANSSAGKGGSSG